jgi:hypothetical protein
VNLAQRIAGSITLLVVAVFLFRTGRGLIDAFNSSYFEVLRWAVWTTAQVTIAGAILLAGGTAVLLLGIRRKRAAPTETKHTESTPKP